MMNGPAHAPPIVKSDSQGSIEGRGVWACEGGSGEAIATSSAHARVECVRFIGTPYIGSWHRVSVVMTSFISATPASRPLRLRRAAEVQQEFLRALREADGVLAAHCVHELWMRGEMGVNVNAMLERVWQSCGESVPEWLPMRHVEWLARAYEVTAQIERVGKGRSNIYLVLLDYSDSRPDPYGLYVGMSRYAARERFDQHKAGIRAAGSVLKRGIEVLTGPVMHLQKMRRADAERIEAQLAEALTAAGLFVKGGH
jgi:hypothetical protein